MNGFFQNLLARSRTHSNVVRPRIPSMFESPGEIGVEQPFSANEERTVSSSAPSVSSASEFPAIHGEVSDSSELHVSPIRKERHAIADPSTVDGTKRPVQDAPRESEWMRENPSTISMPSSMAPLAEKAGAITADGRPRSVPPEPAQSELLREIRFVDPQSGRQSYPALDASRAEKFTSQKSGSEASEIVYQRHILVDRSADPGANRANPTATTRATPVSQAEAEPEIHVSIGRIEVRATVDAQPSRKSQPASPVMGLEEYLRRRGGGGAP
jgi:hypothetical protein